MPSIDKKAIVRRFFEVAINERNYSVLDELIATDFVLHSSMLGEVRGGAAFKQNALALVKPCPDLRVTIDDLLDAERDMSIARVTYRGTDTGGLLPGVPPKGTPFEFTAIYLWRLVNGELAELWQEADRARLLQQLSKPST